MTTDAITITAKIQLDATSFVPEYDQEFFTSFMLKRWKHSPNTHCCYKSVLKDLYNYFHKPMMDVSRKEAKIYFEKLNCSNLSLPSKKQKAAMVRTYAEAINEWYNDNGIEHSSPFPRIYDFTASLNLKGKNTKSKLIPDDIMDKLFKATREQSVRDHLFFTLLKRCGMRMSEAGSIRLANINLAERTIITGLEHGCKKTNKNEDDQYLYIFPEDIKPLIRSYLLLLKPGEVWLFPSRISGCTFVNIRTLSDLAQKYSELVGFHIYTHGFRHTLITKRLNNGCPLPISHILVNQKAGDIQLKSYYEREASKLRELFDKWDPYK